MKASMRKASQLTVLLLAALIVWGGQTAGTEAKKSASAKPAGVSGSKKSGGEAREIVGGAPVDANAYIIGPEDVIQVRVWREAELSGQFQVRPDGKISLPLVNEMQAAGVTPQQLAANIAAGLGKYMTQPEVSVAVQQVNSKKYFIIGEVQKPGSYPLTVPTTVLEALVNAGGFRDFANPKKITILRAGQRLRFNYKEVISGKNMGQNILLQTGDQIIVP
jgi:polysaccharide export outer membrane protein